MIRMNKILAGLGLVVAATGIASLSIVGSQPVSTDGFSLLSHSLGVNQRDFRVFNNFADVSANNNTTPHVNFPGATGATMAIWKGHVEWQSLPHGSGNGSGDPVGGNSLGSGGANLDFSYQGETNSYCNNCRTHRVLPGSSGTTLAYQTGGSAWHIRYYETHTWHDGPGNIGGGYDIQGVATHEVGHALGLGHSTSGAATMWPSSNYGGEEERSIASDDIAGLQAIYGVAAATKPALTGADGTFEPGSVLTLTGTNFSTANNKVWFTGADGSQTILKVDGVPSIDGGTRIDVVIPVGAAKGDVLVQRNQVGNAALSNAWPLNLITGGGDPPLITGLSQTSGPNAGYTPINIFGVGFTGVDTVRFGDQDAPDFEVLGPGNIAVTTPPGSLNLVVDVTVMDEDGQSVLPDGYTYTFNQPTVVDSTGPSAGPTAGGTVVTITGDNCVPTYSVLFDGIEGTDLTVISQNEITVRTPPHAAGAVDIEVNGYGNTIFPAAFTYQDAGAFVDLGPGLAGATGLPVLTGSGDLTPGTGNFTLSMTGAAPGAFGLWWASLTEGSNTLLCGPLYPSVPFLIEVPIQADGAGEIIAPASMPSGSAGLSVVMQMWFDDPTAVCGASASNGLRIDVP